MKQSRNLNLHFKHLLQLIIFGIRNDVPTKNFKILYE